MEPDYSLAGITLSGAARYGRNDAGPVNAGAATSGGRMGLVSSTEVWSLTAKDSGMVVSEFGVIFAYHGAGASLGPVTATFTDDSTSIYTPANNPTTVGTYEFVGFQAPAGLGIKSITVVDNAGGSWLAYDDVMYAVSPVPEPGITSLGVLGLAGCLRRRRPRA